MSKPLTFEFHISRTARDRYGFAEKLFSLTGNVVFANLAAAREFAKRMNDLREREQQPGREPVRPGELNAMGLIDEALHMIIARYREQRDTRVMRDALTWFEARLGEDALHRTLLAFAESFPVVSVYRGERGAADWLADSSEGIPHRAVALEELMMLWLANRNPGFKPFVELFDDSELAKTTLYGQLTSALYSYFEMRPRFGPENQNLLDMLRAPALASPDSLAGQLAFIRDKWSGLLGDFMQRLLTSLDVLKEEEIAVWMRFHPHGPHFGGAGLEGDSSAAAIPSFAHAAHEYERFSPDVDWMPRTVLIAKSVYVWLHQLSLAYGRNIERLDQVPDEELNTLSRRGFNALWLIGVWQRSRASQRVKQLTGNPEAAASAYSLADYTIADDLGGEPAFLNLRERAWARGIRLASDMVPNHMGIDSRWVVQHPDWFLSLPQSPYPSYAFNGPDLSSDGRVEIKIDDHYYDRTDAAVVFRRTDRWTGDTRYIYHGNDGTSFPWNDTAQLNYLHPEVREAVIQTILHVARLFPIIRFDAAMTLTRQHYQRLWFPVPGTGGAIPSRAEHGLTKPQFDSAMPNEFWRELVDRVAAEVPDTLLLAEAFWLLEGYFVRTLGMHRVYNSAFMNMLRDEENANYRSVIKNTLEFDPDVLKRYVNFMNNPDERTAVDQFGKGDKYFGVCTMMATLPGLPMFGHGQVEGYGERYGMEYKRAYHDESPDAWLVARHEREIAPLLHRRPLFAEVRDFLLYDFYTDDGFVNEDVFAYSNRRGNERSLVIYHNRYASTSGWIRLSCSYAEKNADGSKHMRQRTIGEAFGLSHDSGMFVAYRDAVTGLEYLHRAGEVAAKGLHVHLEAYKCHVLLDWRDIRDDGRRPWSELCDILGGQGVPSIDDSLRALELKPVHDALRALLDPAIAAEFAENVAAAVPPLSRPPVAKPTATSEPAEDERPSEAKEPVAAGKLRLLPELIAELGVRLGVLLEQSQHFAPGDSVRHGSVEAAIQNFERVLTSATRLPGLEGQFSTLWPDEVRSVLPSTAPTVSAAAIWCSVFAWAAMEALGTVQNPDDCEQAATELFDTLRLRAPLAEMLERCGLAGEARWQAAARVRAAFADISWAPLEEVAPSRRLSVAPLTWLHDPDIRWLLGVHEHEGVRYFNKESFERLLWWMAFRPLLHIAASPEPDMTAVVALERRLQARTKMAIDAGYRVEALLEPAS